MKKININNLQVDENLFLFINNEAIKETDIEVDNFWNGFSKAVHYLAPINKKLIQKRDQIQKQIDEWHLSKKGKSFDKNEYLSFLKTIGYLEAKEVLTNNLKIDEAIELTSIKTIQFAKRQKTWFRNKNNPIWLNNKNLLKDAIIKIESFLG